MIGDSWDVFTKQALVEKHFHFIGIKFPLPTPMITLLVFERCAII